MDWMDLGSSGLVVGCPLRKLGELKLKDEVDWGSGSRLIALLISPLPLEPGLDPNTENGGFPNLRSS